MALDRPTFCLTSFFQLVSFTVFSYLEISGPRVQHTVIPYSAFPTFFEGIHQNGYLYNENLY